MGQRPPTDVYFDDGTLLEIASIANSASVSFSQEAFRQIFRAPAMRRRLSEVTAGFLADSDSPVQPSGVNPGEVLSILFQSADRRTHADVLNELRTGELRIGLCGHSESDGRFTGLSQLLETCPR